jgi:hypothetical protein
MYNWIKNNFYCFVDDFGDECFTFDFNNLKIIAKIQTFINAFGENQPNSINDLIVKDEEDKKGWHKYFDEWKNKGIIN